MYCPACADTTLTMAERHGIEIDYCPKCRGVWLDRGELDKIIERSAPAAAAPQAAPRAPAYPPRQAPPPPAPEFRREYRDRDIDHDDHDHRHRDQRHYGEPRRKREGFLSDLFDFD